MQNENSNPSPNENKAWYKKWWIWVVGTIIFFGIIGLFTGDNYDDVELQNRPNIAQTQREETVPALTPAPTLSPTPTPATIEANENDDVIFADFIGFHQFTTIKLGTSIDDALVIMGTPSSSMTMNILGVESTTKSWWTINLFRLSTSETVTFTNGYATSVMSTADASSRISANDFNQVSSGMSELEVFEILGAPYSVTVAEFMGMTSTTVAWTNANFTSGTVTFTNGAVSSTMSMGLN
ncbi:MAG: hypothetical protein FWC16_15000 [Defluviitaleaceae bacterium]|nr:hypothetical protein [Defluviitaleaceae bacterium]MCL2276224.1 hypothetical protein [Defluviitaleaceae bacterium]